ncbi:MAG: dihydrolipoamide acetyltransferase family protein [Bacteroidia bacterium]|nr:2-oxo acid dehydrogenase subunit E2 [Bacteroidia bacterium]MDW8158485.1 dihydrolipoamide acetyltransferase family protein [Bacteroidia bacterium]
MARVEMVMPKMGESIMEATIIRWTKKVGERIEAEETVLEIATDKVDSEVPAPVSGILEEIRFKEGDVVPVGTVIAVIETEVESTKKPEPVIVGTAQSTNKMPEPVLAAAQKIESIQGQVAGVNPVLTAALLAEPIRGRFYSPLVLNIAREENISMDELDRIPGTGQEGRVTKKDILEYVEKRNTLKAQVVSTPPVSEFQQPAAPVVTPPVQIPVVEAPPPTSSSPTITQPSYAEKITSSTPAAATVATSIPSSTSKTGSLNTSIGFPNIATKTYSYTGEYEILEMDRMRKMIAENMVLSKHVAPHVTSFVEADVTNIVLWRERNKEIFEKKYNQKLTYTPIFVELVARAIRDFPMVNISVDGDKIILKKDINISLAVALPSGNLIVPTIRKADMLNLAGLATAVNDLTARARQNKLTPNDIADGTYTISNVGTFGNVMGTPIIMQPQVAVLAIGAIRKKPAVIETPTGDVIGIRHFMFLSHSYDHRVIDGALGGQFVRRVADYIESWDINREV